MQRIFAKIKLLSNKLKPKNKFGWFGFGILLLLSTILIVDAVFAAGTNEPGIFVGSLLQFATWVSVALATLCIKISIFLLQFIIEIAGYNGYLSTPAVTVGWVMVRDITNMFFVIILLIIAFGTILGLEQYEWKKLMVKFVLAAILVNFSRTICGIFIDAAQVFMVTFVNAVAATAGGNLMRMFKMESIISMTGGSSDKYNNANVFAAAAAGLAFAAIMMSVMFAYMIILLMRMLVLWVLIILSPLAFVLSVIPQTQSYAARWWKEFGSHVMVGPILIFFVWLSFVTAGAGNIYDHVHEKSILSAQMNSETIDAETNQIGEADAGMAKILQWTNMANFFIAIGMLIVGVRMTTELGVEGGSIASKAVDFGKKVAMWGTGASAGIWAVKSTAGLVKKGATGAAKLAGEGLLYVSPYEEVKNFGKRQWASFGAWRKHTGMKPVYEKYTKEDGTKGERIAKWIPEEMGFIQKQFAKRASAKAESAKTLKKTENFLEVREDLLDKRTTGVPKGWFMKDWEEHDAYDRVEQGMLKAEKGRSEAKTREYSAIGEDLVEKNKRVKDLGVQEKKPTIMEQRVGHEERAKAIEAVHAREESDERKKLHAKDADLAEKRIAKSPEVKKATIDVKEAEEALSQVELGIDTTGVDKVIANLDERLTLTKTKLDGLVSASEAEGLTPEQREDMQPAINEARTEYKDAMNRKKDEELRKQGMYEENEDYQKTKVVLAEKKEDLKKTIEEEKLKESEKTLIGLINLAEQGKQAADAFVEGIKEKDLRDKFKKASNLIEDVINNPASKGDPKLIQKALENLAKQNVYVNAKREAALKERAVRERTVREAQAGDSAYDAALGMAQGGRSQSTALADGADILKREYAQLERTQAQKLASDRIAKLMVTREENGGELDIADEMALSAAMGAIGVEAWTDDVTDHVFDQIKKLESTPEEGGFKDDEKDTEEYKKAVEMKNLAMIMKWGTDKTKFKEEIQAGGDYGRRQSGQLQNLAMFGGDAKSARAHNIIEDWEEKEEKKLDGMADGTTEEKKAKEKAWNEYNGKNYFEKAKIAEKEGLFKELGNFTAQNYIDRIKVSQDFGQSAARDNTISAYATNHPESAHNQQYDTKIGYIRPSTVREARTETIADLDKIPVSTRAKAQIHGYGDMDMNNHLMSHIDHLMYRANMSGVEQEYQYSQYVPTRTRARLRGRLTSEENDRDDGDYAYYGGEAMTKSHEGDVRGSKKRGQHVVKDYLLPQILGDIKSFLIGNTTDFSHIEMAEANLGKIKVVVDGCAKDGTNARVNKLSDLYNLIKNNQELETAVLTKFTTKDIEQLKVIADKIEKGGAGLKVPKPGGKSGGETPEEAKVE